MDDTAVKRVCVPAINENMTNDALNAQQRVLLDRLLDRVANQRRGADELAAARHLKKQLELPFYYVPE